MPKKEFVAVRHLLSFGPLARSIEDLKLAFSIISGADSKDVDAPSIPVIYPRPMPLKSIRIAWTDNFAGATVSRDTRAAMETLVKKLKAKGITVEKVNPPGFDFNVAWKTYGNLSDMEMGAYIPSFFRLLMYLSRANKSMVFPHSHEKYLKVLTTRDELVSTMEIFLSDYDAWLCPVAMTAAYGHILPEKYRGPFPVYKQKIIVDGYPVDYWAANVAYTTILNITGNPVVVMPMGYTRSGLPIGVQIVGSRWQDAKLLIVAEQLNDAGGDFKHPPGFR
jgi:amidase